MDSGKRHRIPVICADIIHLLKDKKQLSNVLAGGRILEIIETDKGFTVAYLDKKELYQKRNSVVQKIINCSGPQLNPAKYGFIIA
jgi:hypothetical protein